MIALVSCYTIVPPLTLKTNHAPNTLPPEQQNTFRGLIWVPKVSFWGVLGASLVYKSGLRLLIRATEVPFLVTPKWSKRGHFSHFGGAKNGTSVAQIKILRPLLQTKLAPKTPQKVTLGTQIGPQKVNFGHFAFFYIFTPFGCLMYSRIRSYLVIGYFF